SHRDESRRASPSSSRFGLRSPNTQRPVRTKPSHLRKRYASSSSPFLFPSKRHVETLVECVLVEHVRTGVLDLLVGHLVQVDVENRDPQVLLHDLLLRQRLKFGAIALGQRGAALLQLLVGLGVLPVRS